MSKIVGAEPPLRKTGRRRAPALFRDNRPQPSLVAERQSENEERVVRPSVQQVNRPTMFDPV